MPLIRVIDFETTGVEPPKAAICQVGKCDVHVEDAKCIETREAGYVTRIAFPYSMFVNPGHPIPPEARGVHHIRDRDIAEAPPVDAGVKMLMETDGRPDAFVAHNAKFERQFFEGGGIPWIDTYKVAFRLWPEAPNHQNQTLRYVLDIDSRHDFQTELALPAHRAGPDAYVTAHILAVALEHTTVEQMIEWSNQPSLLPGSIHFGKHKGTAWSQVVPSYLDWICKQDNMDADVKFTARHWLNRRRSDDR
jgi:exodeoxyribonuclease X